MHVTGTDCTKATGLFTLLNSETERALIVPNYGHNLFDIPDNMCPV